MSVLHKLLLFVLFFIPFLKASAQQEKSNIDSLLQLPKILPSSISFDEIVHYQDSFKLIEDVLPQVQRQIQTRRDFIAYQDLGTHFSPLFDLGNIYSSTAGFNMGNHTLDAFVTQPEERRFYNAPMPFTGFRYSQGGEGYIQFDALHTQNIIPTWNVAAGIQSFTNGGISVRTLQEHRAPFITTRFTHPNQRFRIIGSYNWLRRGGYVSGGLSQRDSQVFVSDVGGTEKRPFVEWYNLIEPGVSRNSLSVGLNNAFDTVRITNHLTRFQYNIGPKYMDTADSISKVKPVANIFYQLKYQNQSWVHEHGSGDNEYFQRLYNQPVSFLRDSIGFRLYDQRAGINKMRTNANGISLGGFVGIQNGSYRQRDAFVLNIVNTYLGGDMEMQLPKSIGLKADAQFFVSGFNGGDYRINARASQQNKWFNVSAYVQSAIVAPSPQQRAFVTPFTNQVRNNLQKMNSNEVGAELWVEKFKNPLYAKIKIQNVGNFIYYNSDFLITQSPNAIQHSKITIGKLFQYRSLHWRLDGFAQQITGNSDIELPNWGAKSDLYFRKLVSKGALDLKMGLDVFIHARHNALGYMPMLRQFYFDPTQAQQLGQYPLLNAYVSGRIKTFIFFAKMENVLDLFYVQRETISFSTFGYPMQPMAFRLGFKWDFYL